MSTTGLGVPCICPAGSDHSDAASPGVDTGPLPVRRSLPARRPPRVVDPDVYQPSQRPPVTTAKCYTCGSTTQLVVTEKNKVVAALDVDAVEDGNIVMVPTPEGPRARFFGPGKTPDVPGPRRVLHKVSCIGGSTRVTDDRYLRRTDRSVT